MFSRLGCDAVRSGMRLLTFLQYLIPPYLLRWFHEEVTDL